MKYSIIYNLSIPHILLDCDQQEEYSRLYYSIKTLRAYTKADVIIYHDSKTPIEEFFYTPNKINIIKDFDNIKIKKIFDYDGDFINFVKTSSENIDSDLLFYLPPNSVFQNFSDDNMEFFNNDYIWKIGNFVNNILITRKPLIENIEQSESKIIPESFLGYYTSYGNINHNNTYCCSNFPIVVYDPDYSENWISSQFWNCTIKKRINNSLRNICHYCSRVIG